MDKSQKQLKTALHTGCMCSLTGHNRLNCTFSSYKIRFYTRCEYFSSTQCWLFFRTVSSRLEISNEIRLIPVSRWNIWFTLKHWRAVNYTGVFFHSPFACWMCVCLCAYVHTPSLLKVTAHDTSFSLSHCFCCCCYFFFFFLWFSPVCADRTVTQ